MDEERGVWYSHRDLLTGDGREDGDEGEEDHRDDEGDDDTVPRKVRMSRICGAGEEERWEGRKGKEKKERSIVARDKPSERSEEEGRQISGQ